jgi:dTDP-4-dehydrorhamnose 3,5-epimerase
MKFTETALPGVYLIDIDTIADERGFFARTLCVNEFTQHGMHAHFAQQSISYNRRAGTLRGLHYQSAPHEEEKLVRVTRGAIFDVVVDLRRESPTFRAWFGIELTADNRRQIYIPRGIAHGFQTLLPDTEIFYEITTPYQASAAKGLRWDDPALHIAWPDCAERLISAQDRALPLFKDIA